MKPTKTLIRALRETAHNLRQGCIYDWWHMTECNCGLLAQTITGMNATELRGAMGGMPGCWTHSASDEYSYCKRTGEPLHAVFKTLADAGVEQKDYVAIEHLRGPGSDLLDTGYYKDRANVARWMDAQADALEQRRAAGERPEAVA